LEAEIFTTAIAREYKVGHKKSLVKLFVYGRYSTSKLDNFSMAKLFKDS
jgi:hypothetical protein